VDNANVQLGVPALGNVDDDATLELPVHPLPSDEGDDNDILITVK